MQTLGKALWSGTISGASARTRNDARSPESLGFRGPISQALYWLAFEVANVIVRGPRRTP
jgi:hypothetical protein